MICIVKKKTINADDLIVAKMISIEKTENDLKISSEPPKNISNKLASQQHCHIKHLSQSPHHQKKINFQHPQACFLGHYHFLKINRCTMYK